jgi:hypothetical protein
MAKDKDELGKLKAEINRTMFVAGECRVRGAKEKDELGKLKAEREERDQRKA